MERGDVESLPGGDISLRVMSRSAAHTDIQGPRITSKRKVTCKGQETGMVLACSQSKKNE